MTGVTLDSLDEIRDEVVATLQLDFDLGERVFEAVAEVDELVINACDPEAEDGDEGDEEGGASHACCPLGASATASAAAAVAKARAAAAAAGVEMAAAAAAATAAAATMRVLNFMRKSPKGIGVNSRVQCWGCA